MKTLNISPAWETLSDTFPVLTTVLSDSFSEQLVLFPTPVAFHATKSWLLEHALIWLLVLRRPSLVQLRISHLVSDKSLLDLCIACNQRSRTCRFVFQTSSFSAISLIVSRLRGTWLMIEVDFQIGRLLLFSLLSELIRGLIDQIRSLDLYLLNLIDDVPLRHVNILVGTLLLLCQVFCSSPGMHSRSGLDMVRGRPINWIRPIDSVWIKRIHWSQFILFQNGRRHLLKWVRCLYLSKSFSLLTLVPLTIQIWLRDFRTKFISHLSLFGNPPTLPSSDRIFFGLLGYLNWIEEIIQSKRAAALLDPIKALDGSALNQFLLSIGWVFVLTNRAKNWIQVLAFSGMSLFGNLEHLYVLFVVTTILAKNILGKVTSSSLLFVSIHVDHTDVLLNKRVFLKVFRLQVVVWSIPFHGQSFGLALCFCFKSFRGCWLVVIWA